MKKKTSNMRCAYDGCKKKIKITAFKCRCGKLFCPLHRIPETHDCSFNFKEQNNLINKDILMKKNGLGGGVARKIEVI